MNMTRTLAFAVLGLVLFTRALHCQDRFWYRDLPLGADLSWASAAAKVAAPDAEKIYQRPRPPVIQELNWRPSHLVTGSPAPQNRPVQQIVFSLSHNQLSTLVVDSTLDRTIDADIVDAISTAYGPSLRPAVKRTRTVTSPIEGKAILPWGLRRSGAGIGLTVSGVAISIQRHGLKLSKSVTF